MSTFWPGGVQRSSIPSPSPPVIVLLRIRVLASPVPAGDVTDIAGATFPGSAILFPSASVTSGRLVPSSLTLTKPPVPPMLLNVLPTMSSCTLHDRSAPSRTSKLLMPPALTPAVSVPLNTLLVIATPFIWGSSAGGSAVLILQEAPTAGAEESTHITPRTPLALPATMES